MRHIFKIDSGKNQRTIYLLSIISLIFFIFLKIFPFNKIIYEDMINASKIMANAIEIIRGCRERIKPINKEEDPNFTGLIGTKWSPLTTSLGNLKSKRTTTNPNLAGLIVFLLNKAGVGKGDTIAVGTSGSFPGLIIAVLSAGKALNLKTLIICSAGASQWGANNPDFNLLDMWNCLQKSGIFDTKPIAFSVGGEKDTGMNLASDVRDLIKNEIKRRGIYFINEENLRKNVKIRISLYKKTAGNKKIKAFINIGGNWANLGEDPGILRLKPGIVKIKKYPSIEKRGMIYEMYLKGVPVIHLLYIKGLVKKYGLPWDPIPLPAPGDGKIYDLIKYKTPAFTFILCLYFLILILIFVFQKKLEKRI